MGPLILIPLFLLALAAVAGIVYGFYVFSQRQIPAAPPQPALAGPAPVSVRTSPTRTPERAAPPAEAWVEGDDLLRYPKRLADLERKLAQGYNDALLQGNHLEERRTSLREKPGREAIAERYTSDHALLQRRAGSMRRVLGLVWRTRAILELRAHLAITARQRPNLEGLPSADVEHSRLDAAVEAYEGAAHRVRLFVASIASRADEIPLVIPREPEDAEVTDALRREIGEERARILSTYAQLQERMDHLADTLLYLADRCRTRRVVEGTAASIRAEDAAGEALIDGVSQALQELNALAEVGEIHLADSTLDVLGEDISQLERAGLEVQAEADAAMEVARLLEQFSTP